MVNTTGNCPFYQVSGGSGHILVHKGEFVVPYSNAGFTCLHCGGWVVFEK